MIFHWSSNFIIDDSQINFTILAPGGCLQYFIGVSGQVSSFNYNDAGGLMLSNTDYTICIRTERNFCGVQYTPCIDTGGAHQ